MTFEDVMDKPLYAVDQAEKERFLRDRMNELTGLHFRKCGEYANILNAFGYDTKRTHDLSDIPFLPVRLFKELKLISVSEDEVVKTMTSSGTTGQAVSRIYLDKRTASNQQKALIRIVSDFTGRERMPMIIIDQEAVIKDRNMFSARGAGILGFSMFGSKRFFALDENMKLDVEGLTAFLERFKGQRILLFGFTFMIWQHFVKELRELRNRGFVFDLSEGVLIHGGGWKKLLSEAVDTEEFKATLTELCGLSDVHDYYGMVEQTGCIYMQCECGHLHASIFSDVIFRRPGDFSLCDAGEKGIIQVLSVIPESYPGHSLLTEDEGILLGTDDCPCGRKGRYFKVCGRIKNAEIRGCSDTYGGVTR